eukprot:25681-Chlamydomonas_euryale.AAC.6
MQPCQLNAVVWTSSCWSLGSWWLGCWRLGNWQPLAARQLVAQQLGSLAAWQLDSWHIGSWQLAAQRFTAVSIGICDSHMQRGVALPMECAPVEGGTIEAGQGQCRWPAIGGEGRWGGWVGGWVALSSHRDLRSPPRQPSPAASPTTPSALCWRPIRSRSDARTAVPTRPSPKKASSATPVGEQHYPNDTGCCHRQGDKESPGGNVAHGSATRYRSSRTGSEAPAACLLSTASHGRAAR